MAALFTRALIQILSGFPAYDSEQHFHLLEHTQKTKSDCKLKQSQVTVQPYTKIVGTYFFFFSILAHANIVFANGVTTWAVMRSKSNVMHRSTTRKLCNPVTVRALEQELTLSPIFSFVKSPGNYLTGRTVENTDHYVLTHSASNA